MDRPRIGIPLTLDDQGRWRPGRDYLYIDRRYADSIHLAGGLPVHLPIQAEPEALVAGLDGLLLPGGDDLRPDVARGERSIAPLELNWVADDQLAFDLGLLREATRTGTPVLGICYGMQLLAREGGGLLESHLPSRQPEPAEHDLRGVDEGHAVTIEPGTRLAAIFGGTEGRVNSLHQQAVAEVGSRHVITARSPDGVVEGIEACDAEDTFEVGVQWHPEKLDNVESLELFREFVTFARKGAGRRSQKAVAKREELDPGRTRAST